MNENFNALGRAVACLQDALANSQRQLRTTESRVADLTRQLQNQQPRLQQSRLRACRSTGGDVVYLPGNEPCSRLGPGYESAADLPTYVVIVPPRE